jgi:hypothetical protein
MDGWTGRASTSSSSSSIERAGQLADAGAGGTRIGAAGTARRSDRP